MSALLEASGLSKNFTTGDNASPAVCNVSFTVAPGECLGLVGESGCGKSTLARLLMGLTCADSGTVSFNGQPLDFADAALRKNYYRQVQLVFQNAAAAFHPRKSIGSSIMLPMLNYGWNKGAARERLSALLQATGLTPRHAEKFPHQLSGGECQRAAIARAISIKPQLLVCDEITSALDVQIQAEIMQLLLKLQAETRMSLLFISHDITLVQEICQRIMIMQSGTIIESGSALNIITRPQQPYTRALVAAAFNLTKI